jgi:hypothetical protein
MSCDNVQELISSLLDGKVPAGERENVLAHTGECRRCSAHLESLEAQRAMLRGMAHASVPSALAAKLRVLASHERELQLARVSFGTRVRRWASRMELAFDNMMRPVALPFTGGLLYALLMFTLLMPRLSFSHQAGGHEFSTFPTGIIVTNPYDQVADADEDFPRIEPVNSDPSDYLNVVDLIIDENGKVVDWSVVRGELTKDMQSVILFSHFEAATNMGVATSGKIRMVQVAPSATVRG